MECLQRQRENVRMLQARGGADFAQESFAAQRRTQVQVQHLDGDITIVLEVVREIHGGHAALAECAVDAIAAAKGGGEAGRPSVVMAVLRAWGR